ncbi:spore germination protein, partial [Dysosmobacter welbionis]
MNRISSNYEENVQWFNDVLGAGRSCDMVCRDLYVGGRRARFWVIDGFGGDAILERMGAFWLSLQPEAVQGLTEMQQFADRYVTFMEVNVSYDRDDIVTSVLMGKSLLVMEGLSGAALIDAKEYPSRSVGEPPDGKVLRGSHDGFIEAVVPNMAMLRRRIRDPHLTMEGLKVGQRTHSDVALCYLDDRVDHALLDELRHKLQNIQANSLTMAQESVAEAIRPKQWYNPFPKVRYTERPDTAAACVMEGSIILMVDNSAAVMILPTTFFDFTQEANDFYFPPLVGTYLRVLRVTVFLISLLITPAWYLMVSSPGRLPSWLDFLSSPEPAALSLLSQLLVVEFLIDVLKLASLNTP